jgi:PPOX class probable F420-dependent enzyme
MAFILSMRGPQSRTFAGRREGPAQEAPPLCFSKHYPALSDVFTFEELSSQMTTTTADQAASVMTDDVKAFLDEVQPAVIGTIRADGSVQMNPVWFERRGDEIWLNPASSRRWGTRLDPGARVTLLMVDPRNMWRWTQIQATVIEKTRSGGEEHIDRLSRRYLGRDYANHMPDDPRLVVRVRPERVTGTFSDTA